MRCMIIDDERLALDSMKKMVGELETFERLETYLNPQEAIRAAEADKFDVAFLDMEMAELTGLETARCLLGIHPDMAIVFVTAYREYAVEAYELNVLDYVVKPVQRHRLGKTWERVRAFLAAKAPAAGGAALDGKPGARPYVRGFRRLELIAAGATSPVPGWRTTRSQELFAYFVYRRGEVVPKDYLHDLFWANHDPDKVSSNLYVSISIIRKQLKLISDRAVLASIEDGYRLDLGDVAYDVEEWERGIPAGGRWQPDQVERALESLALYRGDYLEEHSYDWAEPERQRLRLSWFECAHSLADQLVRLKRYKEASGLLCELRERFPLVEYGYYELMKLGAAVGDHDLVTREFDLLCKRLLEELNEHPSSDVTQWYDRWKRRIGEGSE